MPICCAQRDDAAPGQTIEATRLAEALAALRGRRYPGIAELNDAVESLFFAGDDAISHLVRQRLLIGQRVGTVAPEAPTTPLVADWRHQWRRLRLPLSDQHRALDLDLRRPLDLARSRFLHRLTLLSIARMADPTGRGGEGTFHESWQLDPSGDIVGHLSLAAHWGATVERAATARLLDSLPSVERPGRLIEILSGILAADLPGTLSPTLARLEALTLHERQIVELMRSLPGLIEIRRYGSIRGHDPALLSAILDSLLARVTLGLPAAALSASPAEAESILSAMQAIDRTIPLTGRREDVVTWRETLARLLDRRGIASLIAGGACRLLLLSGDLSAARAREWIEPALSPANPPIDVSLRLAGLLSPADEALLHDRRLVGLIDHWLSGIHEDHFHRVLPMLRRAFSGLDSETRRRLRQTLAGTAASLSRNDEIDPRRAALVLPVLARLLGLATPPHGRPADREVAE